MSDAGLDSEARGDALVWDLPVRLTHWGIVTCVVGAWFTQEAVETDWFWLHTWFGYGLIVLVVTRIVWGFVGTRHARFRRFVRGPREIWSYAGSLLRGPHQAHAGHNPLGALMILLLLAALLAQAATGLFANDEIVNVGPLYGYVSSELSNQLTTWHARLFDALLWAIGLHVLAVFVYFLVLDEDLLWPMISGRKPQALVSPEDQIAASRWGLWIAILVVVAAALWLLIATAPEASLFSF